MEINKIHKIDCIKGLKQLKDKSINLIVTDPPYYKIMQKDHKGTKYNWDNQWETFEDYLKWCRIWFNELKRVLKDNGSLYIFADDKICAYIQVELDKLFKLENSITWVKPNNMTIKGWNEFRSYAPITERILFYSNDISKTGLMKIYDNIDCFVSIKKYLKDEKIKSGLTNKDFNLMFSEFYNKQGCKDRSVIEHYFGLNQWVFPTKEIYKNILQKTGFFQRKYEELRLEYEELRLEYEELRRPFNPKRNFTDVWTFNIIGGKESVNHPTQKPITLIRRIIETSSKEDDLVLDCFMGSGTTAVACQQLNRDFIGFELEEEYINIANKRLEQKNLLIMFQKGD